MKVIQAYAETEEFVPVGVTVSGSPVASGVEFAVLPEGVRPTETDWAAADTLGSDTGLILAGKAPGYYWVWVRVDADTEQPVFVGLHIRVR